MVFFFLAKEGGRSFLWLKNEKYMRMLVGRGGGNIQIFCTPYANDNNSTRLLLDWNLLEIVSFYCVLFSTIKHVVKYRCRRRPIYVI